MASSASSQVKVTGAYASETDAGLRRLLATDFVHVGEDAVQRSGDGAYAAIAPGEISLYGAGWPCQPWSLAGSCLGCSDIRHKVFQAVLGFIEEKLPRALVLENVVRASKNATVKRKLFSTLKACGYRYTHRVIDSRKYGLPQHRLRWYVVALRGSTTDMEDVWAHADAHVGGHHTKVEGWLDLDLPWHQFGELQSSGRPASFKRNLAYVEMVTRKLCSSSKDFVIADMGASAQRQHASINECPCITSTRGKSRRLWVALVRAGTIISMRPLSIRELFRLQGWSSTEFDVFRRHIGDCCQTFPSDTALGHAIGNSMSLAVVKHITSWLLPHLMKPMA